MRKILGILAALIAVLGVSWLLLHRKNESQSVFVAPPENPAPLQQAGSMFKYNFDSDSVGFLPAKFHSARTGQGPSSQWVVLADSTAPSEPNVVAQTSVDTTDYRFPLLVADEASFRDLEVTVRFKAVSGDMDQAAGLAFRLKDANNYYVARANAREGNYRFFQVVAGSRRPLGGANLEVTSQQWHELRVECVGNRIICYYDGIKKIEATNDTFKEAGKVGLWTKADSVTYFDDFRVIAK